MNALVGQLAALGWPVVVGAVGLALVVVWLCRGERPGEGADVPRLSPAERARLKARLMRVFFDGNS